MLGLLVGLLDARLEPVAIVAGRLDVQVIQLLLDVLPDLTVLQEWVQLDYLHNLFLVCVQLMEVEADAVEGAKDRRPQVVVLDNFGEDVADV